MNLLLDTHIALWAITDSPKLTSRARELILDPHNNVSVSSASVWEIAIKHRLGRGDMPVSGKAALGYFQQAGYRLLPVEPEHAAALDNLPTHHNDPFDRMLIAQALIEPMRLVSHDHQVARYGELVICV